MTTRQLRAEIERLQTENTALRRELELELNRNTPQIGDAAPSHPDDLKEIARLRSDADMLWKSVAEKNKEILRLRAARCDTRLSDIVKRLRQRAAQEAVGCGEPPVVGYTGDGRLWTDAADEIERLTSSAPQQPSAGGIEV